MPWRIDDDDDDGDGGGVTELKALADESSDDAEWVPPPVVHAVKAELSDKTERPPPRAKKRPLSTRRSGAAMVPRPLSATSFTASSRASAADVSTTPTARVLQITLTIGDWLDVLDYVGVWNVAQVLSIPTPDSVEVRYDGWGSEYNEIVSLNSRRVAPYHTYTWTVKCWAKYLNWPLWPAVLTVRTPGTVDGAQNLRKLNRLFIDFMDHKNFANRCRTWVKKKDVLPFDQHFERLRKKTTGADFEFSLKHLLKSTATPKFPTFVEGSLPKQHELSLTDPVKKTKKMMGNKMWLKLFANNRERHNNMHGSHTNYIGEEHSPTIAVSVDVCEDVEMATKDREAKPLRTPMKAKQSGASQNY
uniref:PWWP domain-containing protein n=1 Tax=Globisporangium ultimum (strain ATCC 200006 / CBS 805.95 / DAOM BR144) TaxID=431595 RepID=K3WES6_GLOUD